MSYLMTQRVNSSRVFFWRRALEPDLKDEVCLATRQGRDCN